MMGSTEVSTQTVSTQTVSTEASAIFDVPWAGAEMGLRSCGITDIGCHRKRNEDCFGLDDDLRVYIVADGIGGSCRGDLAAHIAAETICDSLMETKVETDSEADSDTQVTSSPLEEAIHKAHAQICQHVDEDPSLDNMGTTVVGLHFESHDRATVAHLGDSRAYRLRGGLLELLTRDHTLANEFAHGNFDLERTSDHPMNHVLTRALTSGRDPVVETRSTSVRAGDVFLLCSDGLTKMLAAAEILVVLEAGGGPEAACHRLIHQALHRGGPDNITVLVIEILLP